MFGTLINKIKNYYIKLLEEVKAQEEAAKEKEAKAKEEATKKETAKKETVKEKPQDKPKEKVNKPVVKGSTRKYLPSGSMAVGVYGTAYDNPQRCLPMINRLVDGGEYGVTLTPQSAYQIEHDWPKPPFVNVNLPGSRKTTKTNWLGYIRMKPSEYDFEYMIKRFGNLDVNLRVGQTNLEDDFTIYIDEDFFKTMFVEHDSEQIKKIDRLAVNYIDLPVEIDGNKLVYQGDVVGTLSLKKATEFKGKKNIACHIDLYRWNDEGNNKHFSRAFFSFPPLPSK